MSHGGVLLVCSEGGHLLQLRALRAAWEGVDRTWVTLDKSDARSLLEGEKVVYAHGPTSRSITNMLRNLVLAWRVVGRIRPRLMLTTGAAVAVPFAWASRLRGVRVVYVESFTRIDTPSLSMRLTAPIADRLYVQWPELARSVRGSRYVGTVFAVK